MSWWGLLHLAPIISGMCCESWHLKGNEKPQLSVILGDYRVPEPSIILFLLNIPNSSSVDYISVWGGAYVHVKAWLRRPETLDPSEAEVTGAYKLPDMGAGDWTLYLTILDPCL